MNNSTSCSTEKIGVFLYFFIWFKWWCYCLSIIPYKFNQSDRWRLLLYHLLWTRRTLVWKVFPYLIPLNKLPCASEFSSACCKPCSERDFTYTFTRTDTERMSEYCSAYIFLMNAIFKRGIVHWVHVCTCECM